MPACGFQASSAYLPRKRRFLTPHSLMPVLSVGLLPRISVIRATGFRGAVGVVVRVGGGVE